MIHVIAVVTAKPGQREPILQALPRERARGQGGEGLHRVRRRPWMPINALAVPDEVWVPIPSW